jgi:ribosomal protein S18 acetylase RimI-like enzyme
VVDTPEVFIASANVPWILMNGAFLPAPVETEAALERSVAAAARYFASRKSGWAFLLCEDWIAPSLRPRIAAVFEAYGAKRFISTIGMVAERVAPPVRSLPHLEIHHATSAEEVRHIADINAVAYATPLEMARESIGIPAVYQQGDCRGYVGYVDGKPVTVSNVTRVGGAAYVGSVATLEEYRRRGYAEALMRHSLEDARRIWGLERTVLHASEAGHPLYRQMGYRDVATFSFYLSFPAP